MLLPVVLLRLSRFRRHHGCMKPAKEATELKPSAESYDNLRIAHEALGMPNPPGTYYIGPLGALVPYIVRTWGLGMFSVRGFWGPRCHPLRTEYWAARGQDPRSVFVQKFEDHVGQDCCVNSSWFSKTGRQPHLIIGCEDEIQASTGICWHHKPAVLSRVCPPKAVPIITGPKKSR